MSLLLGVSKHGENDVSMYAVQHDTQSVLMSEFIQHLC